MGTSVSLARWQQGEQAVAGALKTIKAGSSETLESYENPKSKNVFLPMIHTHTFFRE